MTLPKNAKILYGVATGAIVLAGGFLYMQNNSLTDLKTQVAGLRTTADKEKDAQTTLIQTERDLTGLKERLVHLEKGIPDAAYVPTMLKELEAMGKTQNVEVTGLRPAPPKPNTMGDKKPFDSKPYEPLDLELKGKASYADLLRFVNALNTFPKILEVRTVTIAPGLPGNDTTGNQLEITMGIRAFLFKQNSDEKKDGLSS
jgi:Tfp pilus assembly protein PilO